MATTAKGVVSVHGSNPQNLIEKVIRSRIYDSTYWKEHCFALTAESIIDKAITLNAIGGVYDRQTPTPFICLTLKLLQLQPEKEILFEYLLAEEFKYLRALAALYIRLTFRSLEVYDILEPLMKDYRKLRERLVGGYSLTTFDSFIDELLTKDRVCDIILPRLTQRSVLEEVEGLPPRRSLLETEEAEIRSQTDSDDRGRKEKRRRINSHSPTPSSTRFSSPDLHLPHDASLSPGSGTDSDHAGTRFISRSPSRSPSRGSVSGTEDGELGDTRMRYISRSPSVSPDRALAFEGEQIEGDV